MTDTSPLRPPTDRVAAKMEDWQRGLAALGAVIALVYGGILGWRENSDGIATAAAFAVGLLFAILALTGILPASIEVGDVELKLEQARQQGKVEGETLGMAQGAIKIGEVAALRDPSDVLQEMTAALPAEAPDELKQRAREAIEKAVDVTATAAAAKPDDWHQQAEGARQGLRDAHSNVG
jgi:hypothetical protein